MSTPPAVQDKISAYELDAICNDIMGRRYSMPKAYVYFSQAKFDEICDLLENGMNLRAISRMDGMPTAHNIVRWSKQTPELQAQYALAREHGYSLKADDLIDIADNDISEQVKYRVDARKWLMSKVLPKTFGDKQQVESKVTVDWAQVTQEAMDKWKKEDEADRVVTIDGQPHGCQLLPHHGSATSSSPFRGYDVKEEGG